MIIEKLKKDCCGCTACVAACPVGALTMATDEEGFLYPSLNRELCVDCGKCEKVCAFCEKKEVPVSRDSDYYAVTHKENAIRRKSRSGGVFYALAKEILSHGGAVYGVALDETFCAHTARIDREEALADLQGSKYVQSDKGDSFSKVRDDLAQGRAVLFSGTACEVSGLLSYLNACGASTEKLYTCDLVCHGTPSPKLWQDNLAHMEKKMGGYLDEISFRDKSFGWAPHIESYRRGKRIRYANRYTSVFYSDAALRPSCSSCRFCSYERCSDFTLADFWGVEKLSLPIDTAAGVSCLMVHTEKGSELFKSVKADLNCYPVQKEQTEQPNLKRPSPVSPTREAFWKDYRAHGYLYAAKRFYGPKERLKLVYNVVARRKRT